jgi:tetratricopeptide (TPR) repeat protein
MHQTIPDVLEIDVDMLVQDAIERSIIYLNRGSFQQAEELLRQIAIINKASDHSNHLLALALHRQGKNREAFDLMRALCKKDGKWEYWNSYGVICSALYERKMAITAFQQAIDLDKNAVMAYSNLALEYQGMGDTHKAKFIIKEAMLLGEDQRPMLYFNLGNILLEEQMPKTAAVCFAKTKEGQPEFHPARWNRASALLTDHQYEDGWAEYESRWDIFPNFTKIRDRFAVPQWNGEALDGKSILLYVEQGAGDAIQFVRFTKQLKERGAEKVIIDWRRPTIRGDLTTLLKKVQWVDEVVDCEDAFVFDKVDYKQSLISLPYVMKLNTVDELKCDPYINVDGMEERMENEFLFDKLPKGMFNIGICWAGSPLHYKDNLRSCKVMAFNDFFDIPNAQVFNLQADTRKRVWPGNTNEIDLSEGINTLPIISPFLSPDYAITAKVIARMDLIVTVDTSIAHLAGALGKRTFLMLPYVSDWRWGLHKSQTHWYPSIRLFRQPTPRNWNLAFSEAVSAANALAQKTCGGYPHD